MTKVLTFSIMLLFTSLGAVAQTGVAINQTGATANAYAILDVSSTTKGLLIPRMSQSQLLAISQPANGLLVFNTDNDKLYIFVSSDNQWKPVAYAWDIVTTSTGKTWMDRNLGATEVATSKTDANAYGDLYQWGRAADGHQKRNSQIYDGDNNGLATTAQPNQGNAWDGKFITTSGNSRNWLNSQNNALWQGVDGTNNPCPPGFRLPESTELDKERQKWSSNDDDGAFASPLKLTNAGRRLSADASLNKVGTYGFYWSSTTNGNKINALRINSNSNKTEIVTRYRAIGATIRCIKD